MNEPYTLSQDQIDDYQTNSFIKLREVFNTKEIALFSATISASVDKMRADQPPLAERDTYGQAFMQLFNLWTKDKKVKEIVFNQRLAKNATDLMIAEGVRLYHDQALFKEAGGGITPWHADQHYWPLSSDKTVTAWIPLQETPLEMGTLEFSAKSQALLTGRELAISDESEQVIGEKIRINDFKQIIEPFDVGEVSFHSGWVFHRAGANTTHHERKAMTIIYMDKDMKLSQPKNSDQQNDWQTWYLGAKVGEVIDTHLNTILYEK